MKKIQERKGVPSLRNANRKKLKEEVKKVNGVLEKVDVKDITATKMLIYAGACCYRKVRTEDWEKVPEAGAFVETKAGVSNQRHES